MLNDRYEELTAWLFQQFPSYQQVGALAYKPTLDNTIALLNRIGNPQDRLRYIHVAGSNGKGSVCSMLASILTASGQKTGLFTSPHISDYRERVRINGECIDKETVVSFVEAIRQEDLDFEPSFFEITFALALYHFDRQKCDICVIETGLGGRLDATNVIVPLISVITTISLEHTQILGDTVQLIAREKAGIIKAGIPVVIGKMEPEVRAIFQETAGRLGGTLFESESTDIGAFQLSLLGGYQEDNFRTVLTVCKVLESNYKLSDFIIQKGLDQLIENTGFTGRLHLVQRDPLVIYDVSHNAEGISASLQTVVKMTEGQLRIVYGTSNDKDMKAIVPLFPKTAQMYLSEFKNPRTMKVNDLLAHFQGNSDKKAVGFTVAQKALSTALSESLEQDTIWVTGSFFLIADFL